MIIEIGYGKVRLFTEDRRLMTVREFLTQQRGEIKAVRDFTDFDDLETVQFVFRWWVFRKQIKVEEAVEKQ